MSPSSSSSAAAAAAQVAAANSVNVLSRRPSSGNTAFRPPPNGYTAPPPSSTPSGSRQRSSVQFSYQVPPSRNPSLSAKQSMAEGNAPPLSNATSSSSSTLTETTASTTATPSPSPSPSTSSESSDGPSYDISAYSSTDLLKLLASLLTQIAATNDALTASSPPQPPASTTHHPPIWDTLTTASRHALVTPAATLTFHARNIPSISLEAYLLRILKYCPTTNHVFLSLLVYFDRMARLSGEIEGDDEEDEVMEVDPIQTQTKAPVTSTPRRRRKRPQRSFVIDSYNIHRLVIAGITVASKFFSDVFYTNGRYAKVGGLPLHELNQLELQFLLLNDFRLVISGEEMQRYAEQLILFSKSQANPIVMRVENTTATAHQRSASGVKESAPQPAVMDRHQSTSSEANQGHTHLPLPKPTPRPSMTPATARPEFHPPAWANPMAGSTSSAAHQRKGGQTPKVVAHPSAPSTNSHQPHHSSHHPHLYRQSSQGTSSGSHVHNHGHVQGRQGEFSRAYETQSDDSSDDDDDSSSPHDRDPGCDTETETEGGETDASGSTTSDEPTVKPRRAYAHGRRASMGSMVGGSASTGTDDNVSTASSAASSQENLVGAQQQPQQGSFGGADEETGKAEKTPEVGRGRGEQAMDVDV